MIYIGITPENSRVGEAEFITALLDNGLDALHLRKPTATREEIEVILQAIPTRCHNRIVLHDHFELAEKYQLGGVHLNRRNSRYIPTGEYRPTLSRSCHSLSELSQNDHYKYSFLSPIFDSLSKQGYHSTFTPESLQTAQEQGVINDRVIALGGITPERIPQVREWGFGGVAVLGYLWQHPTVEGVIEQLKQLKNFNSI